MQISSIKSLFAVSMAGLLCVAAAPNSHSSLLSNGSFEDAGDSSDSAAHWSRWGQWFNRETGWTPTHSGTCEMGYHHWQIESADDSGLWQDVAVEKGKAYTFALYAQHDPATAGNDAASVELSMEYADGDKQIKINSKEVKIADLATGKSWTRLQVRGTAPVEHIRVLIRITPSKQSPRAGAVKLDDATLALE